MRLIRPILALAAALAPASGSSAELGEFLARQAEGWFWYQEPTEVEEAVQIAEPTTSALDEVPRSEPSPDPLSSAWIREQLPIWQDRAMDDPSGPAMMIHVLLERLAFAKADRYQQSRMGTRYSDPFLDATSGMPVSTGGVRLARAQADEGTTEVLSALASRAGLWFFYESTCPYCARQVLALNEVASRYGFEVLAISIDGQPLPNWHDRYVDDMGHAELLGVERWPAIFLASPPDSFAQVTTGLVSAPELEKRLISVGLLRGWITQDERNRTRPAQGREPTITELPLDIDEEPTDDELVRLLQAALGRY